MSGKKSLKGYYLTTFLIGLGFFTVGLLDPLYDTYIPIFLGKYISSKSIIGIIMTLDNILAIFLIPIFSAMSDRTVTPIGRRMPYIITLLPLTAILFALVPIAALSSLFYLISAVFLLNLAKQAARGPVVALMPDMVPGDLRSEANGVINTMGGLAAILGTVLLARLMDVKITLPHFGTTDNVLAFPVASIFVILAALMLLLFVKEKNSALSESEKKDSEKKEPLLQSLKAVISEENKSALYILLSLFSWFLGYQGILPFIGTYSKEVLGTSSGTAALASGMVGISYAIFAIPSGKLAHEKGRKKVIRASLLVVIAVMLLITLHSVTIAGSSTASLYIFWALLFVFGTFWVAVVNNSFPMLWQLSTFETIGIYTGLYYFFNQAASVVSPPISGFIIDIFGYPGLFIFVAITMLVSYILMGKVDRGEAED
ncbi:MAG: MFS transporter [Sphaerochaetaceae bacterium]|nr:MFS transporter [Sphaerochaetaceae bacterium]